MNVSELKEMAKKILALEPSKDFQHVAFSCRSGGAPRNKAKVPVIHTESNYEYPTVAGGPAYSGSVTVECRDTGVKDVNGRTIYETPENQVFVFEYRRGSPESFDYGALVDPEFEVK